MVVAGKESPTFSQQANDQRGLQKYDSGGKDSKHQLQSM